MKSSQKTVLAWLALFVATILIFQTAHVNRTEKKIPFNKFIEHVKQKQIDSVTFKGHGRIEGKFKAGVEKGQNFETIGDTSSDYYVKLLNDNNLIPNYEIDDANPVWLQLLVNWGPMLIFILLLV
ncbi:MAG: ATP-dependent metallopeptidase FtsH/Yme1/Tma family protein, partial [Deltaproteobacteria bacterium]|nr:ATP-dependent metallopeptidase FtsH/Yme1/Tma family protein [Deltaproteobacteria bacterium]